MIVQVSVWAKNLLHRKTNYELQYCNICIINLPSGVFGDRESSRLNKRRRTFVTVLTRGTLPAVL